MALLINETCIACDACEPVCPNRAITAGSPIYVIDPDKCTECVGAEDEPQCRLVCPAEPGCIVQNPDYLETKEELLGKYQKLHALRKTLQAAGNWRTESPSTTQRPSDFGCTPLAAI